MVGNVGVVSACSVVLPLLISFYLAPGLIRFLVICIVAVPSTLFVVYRVGCSQAERVFIKEKVSNLKNKLR